MLGCTLGHHLKLTYTFLSINAAEGLGTGSPAAVPIQTGRTPGQSRPSAARWRRPRQTRPASLLDMKGMCWIYPVVAVCDAQLFAGIRLQSPRLWLPSENRQRVPIDILVDTVLDVMQKIEACGGADEADFAVLKQSGVSRSPQPAVSADKVVKPPAAKRVSFREPELASPATSLSRVPVPTSTRDLTPAMTTAPKAVAADTPSADARMPSVFTQLSGEITSSSSEDGFVNSPFAKPQSLKLAWGRPLAVAANKTQPQRRTYASAPVRR